MSPLTDALLDVGPALLALTVPLVALVARALYVRWDERRQPRIYRVIGERSLFTGMNTGAPGFTDPVVVATDLTEREARSVARTWVRQWPYGAATIERRTT